MKLTIQAPCPRAALAVIAAFALIASPAEADAPTKRGAEETAARFLEHLIEGDLHRLQEMIAPADLKATEPLGIYDWYAESRPLLPSRWEVEVMSSEVEEQVDEYVIAYVKVNLIIPEIEDLYLRLWPPQVVTSEFVDSLRSSDMPTFVRSSLVSLVHLNGQWLVITAADEMEWDSMWESAPELRFDDEYLEELATFEKKMKDRFLSDDEVSERVAAMRLPVDVARLLRFEETVIKLDRESSYVRATFAVENGSSHDIKRIRARVYLVRDGDTRLQSSSWALDPAFDPSGLPAGMKSFERILFDGQGAKTGELSIRFDVTELELSE